MTGTFDNWTKSVKLEKEGDVFEKTVDLEDSSKKIYYKVGLIFPLFFSCTFGLPALFFMA